MLEVRGEVYMPEAVFAELNRAQDEAGSGSSSTRATPPPVRCARRTRQSRRRRRLSLWIYQVGFVEGNLRFVSHTGSLDWLRTAGFPVNPKSEHIADLDGVIAFVERVQQQRHTFGYQTDGVVIKVDSLAEQTKPASRRSRRGGRSPTSFSPEEQTTRLRSIEVNVGRTGAVTPYAVLQPVFVGGATVTNATLHNQDEVARKDLRIGDLVVVRRAGDVIPEVVGPVVAARTGKEKKWRMPTACPFCGNPIVRGEGEAVARCSGGFTCPVRLANTYSTLRAAGAWTSRAWASKRSTCCSPRDG